MKRLIKRVLQQSVAFAAPMGWRLREQSLLILMYHRVLPSDHPDRSTEQAGMYVSPETLAMHIDVLRQHFSLVHLDDWVSGQRCSGTACAITFDDGWKDNYDFAFPILKNAQAPATIFLVADMVGSSYSFWPNRLIRLMTQPGSTDLLSSTPAWLAILMKRAASYSKSPGSLDHNATEYVINECKANRTDSEMIQALESIPNLSEGAVRRDLMDWQEAAAMAASGLVRFGSHTKRHMRLLPQVPHKVIRDEVLDSAKIIESNLGTRVTAFCYPNGDYCRAAVELVQARYSSAVTTRYGWNSPASHPYELKRVGVHEDVSRTPTAFLSRLAGVG